MVTLEEFSSVDSFPTLSDGRNDEAKGDVLGDGLESSSDFPSSEPCLENGDCALLEPLGPNEPLLNEEAPAFGIVEGLVDPFGPNELLLNGEEPVFGNVAPLGLKEVLLEPFFANGDDVPTPLVPFGPKETLLDPFFANGDDPVPSLVGLLADAVSVVGSVSLEDFVEAVDPFVAKGDATAPFG